MALTGEDSQQQTCPLCSLAPEQAGMYPDVSAQGISAPCLQVPSEDLCKRDLSTPEQGMTAPVSCIKGPESKMRGQNHLI